MSTDLYDYVRPKQEYHKCKTCGEECPRDLKKTGEPTPDWMRCTNCWEVEFRIRKYLESTNGRSIIKEELEKK